jgi:predicted MFS family arabinose efflux permease
MGGYLADWVGWRGAFIIAGLPGLILAAVIASTLKEPARGMADRIAFGAQKSRPLGESLRLLFSRPSFVRTVFGGCCGIFVIYITNAWLPPYFIRLHGFTAREIGPWIALAVGVGGAIGVFGGGALADALKPRFPRAEIWVLVVSMLLTFPAFLLTVLSYDATLALVGMFLLYSFGYIWLGPTGSIIQSVSPVRSRALATGIQLAVANVIALTLGPPLIGFLSDYFSQTMGPEGLRYALAVGSVVSLLGALIYFWAGWYLLSDLQTASAVASGHTDLSAGAPLGR